MRLASHNEFADAAEKAGILIANGKISVASADAVKFTWEDPINYVFLAKRLVETLTAEEHFLFFHEYGIWRSSENRYLYRLVMKTWFHKDNVNPDQCVYFSLQDRDAAITLLQIGLQSGWGGLLFGDKDNWFYFDHDQLGVIASPSDAREWLNGDVRFKLLS